MSERRWQAEVQGGLVTVWQVIETDGHFEDVIADELTEDQARLIAGAPLLKAALEAIVKADDKALAEYRDLGLGEPPKETKALTEQARTALAASELATKEDRDDG